MREGKLREKFIKRANRKSKVGMVLTRLGKVWKMKKYKAEKN